MSGEKAIALAELWDGDMVARVVSGKKVLLVRLGSDVYAYEDRCAHLGVALSEGELAGDTLTCSAHRYTYDARSGCGKNPRNTRLKSFAVTIVGADVWVDTTRNAP